MIAFIDARRGVHGVEPIWRVLPIVPSTYHAHMARAREPDRAPARQKRDTALCQEIRRVFEENLAVYGVRKVCRQMRPPQKVYPVRNAQVQQDNDIPARFHDNVDVTDAPFDCKPGDPTAVTEQEGSDMVAFLQTLTEGYFPKPR